MKTNILNTEKYWLSDYFKEHILGDIKTVPEFKESFTFHTLTEYTSDEKILEKVGLMTREEILSLLITLTKKQKNGEKGQLLMNGYANIIGYFKDTDGDVRSVRCSWGAGSGQWYCYGWLPDDWYAGAQFLSRNGNLKTLDSSLTLESLKNEFEEFRSKVEKVLKI